MLSNNGFVCQDPNPNFSASMGVAVVMWLGVKPPRPLVGQLSLIQQNPITIMVSTSEFLDFFSKAIPSLQVHPDDEPILKANGHQFHTDTLIGQWMGPVRTAPVVILTLNGCVVGNGEEAAAARMPAARASMAHNLTGDALLPNWEGNPAGRVWTTARLAQFDLSYEEAADKVAFVNLIAYRSKSGSTDMRMADKLPTSLMVRAWMRDTVFPQARAGERAVVCLYSHRHWGLTPGVHEGVSLFAPRCNRQAFMLHSERAPIVEAVHQAVFRATHLGAPPTAWTMSVI
jgi:hypothetical protein